MTYWKLGCNWGKGKPDFYPMILNRGIVICAEHNMQIGDIVAITQGFNVVAIAQIQEHPINCTEFENIKDDFLRYSISYEDWNKVATAKMWTLDKKEQFQYQLQQGICQIQNHTIQSNIKTLVNKKMEEIRFKEYIDLLLANHNLILTGAPGTGKTYLAKQIAKDMGAEYRMVQFHPSFDYTDFVEGVRPIDKDGQIGFERRDGVFKDFCKLALKSPIQNEEEILRKFKEDIKGQTIEVPYVSSPGKEPFAIWVDENNKFRVKLNNDGENLQSAKDEDVIASMKTGERVKNKTYPFSIADYITKRYKSKGKPFVFIIDEINRGEISKIFGELFYSIDPGYRGRKGAVSTQYQNLVKQEDCFSEGFYVPENVYIIGTMNDIDRSVESMDFAMRRRFAWQEISASSRQNMLDEEESWGNYDMPAPTIIEEIKNRMNNLNMAIIDKYCDVPSSKDRIGLTKAYQIGAAYFLKYAQYNDFEMLWKNHLEGLLHEYLRGTSNIEQKMLLLKQAYNDSSKH